MLLFTDTFIPYDFADKHECLTYIISRCQNIKKSLKLIKLENGHLELRCPLVGDYLEIVGTENDINWLHSELTKQRWYKSY